MRKRKVILFFPSVGDVYLSIIPYALLYLEAAIRDLDIEVIIIDENHQKDYSKYLESVSEDILIAGVSVIIGEQIKSCVEFSEWIKNNTDAKVIWGGWFPSLLREQVLAEKYIDYIVIGQGETPFRKLIVSLLENNSIEDINNLGYKKDNKLIINPIDKFIFNPDFHKVNFKLIDVKKYLQNAFGYNATLGCIYKCSFCTTSVIYNHAWYHKDIKQIISDLHYLKREVPEIGNINMEDDNFFLDKKFVLEFSRTLISEGMDINWSGSAHARYILKQYTDEDMALIHSSGCTGIYTGAESGDPEVLKFLNKQSSVQDHLNFVRFLKKHQISSSFSIMVFFPLNPLKDLRLTSQMLIRAHLIDPEFFSVINYYTPCPHTPIYELAKEKGFVFPENNALLVEAFKHKLQTPWVKKRYEYELMLLKYFYFPFSDPEYYKSALKYKPFHYFLNQFFFKIIKFRVFINCFRFPIEAVIYMSLLYLVTGKNYYRGMFEQHSSFKMIIPKTRGYCNVAAG